MQAYISIALVVAVAVQLYTGRTLFWWIAFGFDSADIACRELWRMGGLFLRRWLRDTRAMLLARKAAA